MISESKRAFFRQSGWLVISTVTSGIFLVAVYSLIPPGELGTFTSMLRLFMVLGIVTSGLQVVMAEDTAAAVSPEAKRHLIDTTRSVARGIVVFWAVLAVACLLGRGWIEETLKIPHTGTLVVTLGLVMAQLFLPYSQGLLQGRQLFSWLGWSIMMNGVGRFVAILLLVTVFSRTATTALTGALAGLAGAVLLAIWPARGLVFGRTTGLFRWRPWLKRAVPLSAGSGSLLFLMNADVLFVQANFSSEQTAYYSAVAIVGVGLVAFTTPMATVMFPKLVRSVAQAQKTDSLWLAVSGTLALGLVAVFLCSLFPTLPLRILYYKNPKLWESAQLIPWFMWSMLPMTLANVMVASLLARRDFRAVPLFILIAAGYGLELHRYLGTAGGMELFAAFKGVILRLGLFSGMMLLVGIIFSLRPRRQRFETSSE